MSDEIQDGAVEQAIPLPAEEQGSQLEKTFSKKSLTLLDKIEAEPMRLAEEDGARVV